MLACQHAANTEPCDTKVKPMALIIGVGRRKAAGKSTIARLIARELAAQDWEVKIADLDISQATSYHWRARRLQHAMEPDISIEQYGRVDQALKSAEHFDLLVLDKPHATQATQQIAKAATFAHSDWPRCGRSAARRDAGS